MNYHQKLRAGLLCAAISPLAAVAQSADPLKAEQAYLAGTRLLERNDYAAAETEFLRAEKLAPTRLEYAKAADLTRQQYVTTLIQQAARERMLRHDAAADKLLAQAKKIDPQNEAVLAHLSAVPDQHFPTLDGDLNIAGPIQLNPTLEKKDLHLRGDARQAVQQAMATFGIKPVFDEGITGPPLRFDLEATSYADAMPILLRMTHLFAVPVDSKTVMIAKDTQENRDRLERLIEETVYIPGSSTEQLNELTNIVKNVFDVTKIVSSPSSGTLLIRAPEATIRAVNYTLAELVDGGADVVLRLQLISVDKTHSVNTGATTPTSVGAFSIAAEAQNLVNANQSTLQAAISQGLLTLPSGNSAAQNLLLEAAFLVFYGGVTDAAFTNLITVFGHGLTFFGLNIGGSAALNLALNTSESRALDDITVRIGDRQTTTLRIGSKYPITTATYSSGVSSSTASALAGKTINGVSVSSLLSQYLGSGSSTTVPQVQFEDLGITLKTQPSVLKSGLVTLHIDMKIEALTGSSANNIPILTSRVFTSDLTVEDGTTAVMLSDLSSTESAAISGIPGLADLPGLNQTAADKLKETDSSELVLMVTPTVVRRRSNSIASRRIVFVTSVPQDN